MKWIYHYYAFVVQDDGNLLHYDGLATMNQPIATLADYQGLKSLINERDCKSLVLSNLTLIAQFED